MAFLEKLENIINDAENAVTETGQMVAQQTKNITEINQLNSLISQKTKEMNQIYQDLGKVYFEQHKNIPQDQEVSRILNILTLEKEIKEHEDRIKVIKGYQKCPVCQTDIPSNAKFCPICGTRTQNAEEVPCLNCKKLIKVGSAFCPHCGTKTGGNAQ